MMRHAGGAGTAAPADVPRKRISGRPRVTVRPNYVGLPPVGLDADRTNAGESLRDKVGQRAPVRSRKLRSRGTKSRRDGAPRGERAPRTGARRASQGADLLSAFRRSIPRASVRGRLIPAAAGKATATGRRNYPRDDETRPHKWNRTNGVAGERYARARAFSARPARRQP